MERRPFVKIIISCMFKVKISGTILLKTFRDLIQNLTSSFVFTVEGVKKNKKFDLSINRSLMAFIVVPLMQRELHEFKDITWNSHRIRAQRNTLLPDGIPNHIYQFPEQYQLEDCGNSILLYKFLYSSFRHSSFRKKGRKNGNKSDMRRVFVTFLIYFLGF